MSLIYCINTVWKDMMQFCTSCTFAPADFHLYPPGNKQAWRPLAHDQCWCCSVVLLEHRQLWWILSTSDLIGVLKFPGISFKQFMWWISQCCLLLLKTDCCVAVCPTEASFAYKPWFFFFSIALISAAWIRALGNSFLWVVQKRSVSWQRSEVPARY